MPEPTVADTPVPMTRPGWGWDFSLMALTVALLASLGAQSLAGTGYAWWAHRAVPDWERVGYAGFVAVMNAAAAPQVVALVVVMGLCVPKRLFSRTALVAVSAAMLACGAGAWAVTGSLAKGLAAYLALAALIQVAVVVATVAGTRAPSYLTEGRIAKAGSGLLHLGFVLFASVVVALQDSAWMLPVFAVSALLAVTGSAMSICSNALARSLRSRRSTGP